MGNVHRVVVLAPEGVYPFELGIPSRVFGAADGRYEVLTCTADGRPVRTNSDFSITVEHGPEALRTADTVIIPPFDTCRIIREAPAAVAAALASVVPGARLVSICTGAFVLAAAGLLAGRPPRAGRSRTSFATGTRRWHWIRTSCSSTTGTS